MVPIHEEVKTGQDNPNNWRSCSGCICDKRILVFTSQLGISVTVVLFCMFQLYYSTSCERDSLYSGLLSLILGCWLPSPVNSMSKIK